MVIRSLYAVVLVGYFGALGWAMTQLPARIASHFDDAGQADGWMDRTGYLAMGLGLGVFVLVGLPLLARLLLRGSGVGINVPHKDYWLDPAHPQRRVEFARRFTDDMLAIAAATGVLFAWLHIETVIANRQTPPQTGAATWVALAAYLFVIFGYVALILWKRYTPPEDDPSAIRYR